MLGAVAVGVWRNRRYQTLKELHEAMAERLGLNLAFQFARNYRMFGKYRGYQASVFAIEIKQDQATQPQYATKLQLEMKNPNQKCLRMYPKEENDFVRLFPMEQASPVQHDASNWLTIDSNDLFLTSLILSEDVKISMGVFFKAQPDAIVYLQDDELACILPGLLEEPVQLEAYQTALDLLCDIKDELN